MNKVIEFAISSLVWTSKQIWISFPTVFLTWFTWASAKSIDSKGSSTRIPSGFSSPVRSVNAKIIVDDSVNYGSNFVVGANEKNHHLINVNF